MNNARSDGKKRVADIPNLMHRQKASRRAGIHAGLCSNQDSGTMVKPNMTFKDLYNMCAFQHPSRFSSTVNIGILLMVRLLLVGTLITSWASRFGARRR
jgi:hypothetical protein